MTSIWQDVVFGARMLAKHKLATALCVIALALGIASNTVIFSMTEAFLIHPLGFDREDRVVALVDTRASQEIDMNAVAPATYLDWQHEATSFESLSAHAWEEVNLSSQNEPQKIQGFRVTSNFFDTVGVHPALGRAFLPEENEVGKDHEIILSHAMWRDRFGSDPHVVGELLKVDGLPFTVVGVMPEGFDYPLPVEAWLPLTLDAKARTDRSSRWLWVLGRMKPGIKFSDAAAEMRAIAARQAEAYPDTNKGWTLKPKLLRESVTSNITRQYMILLLAAVGFVLLIAAADVANVQFARVTGRNSEFSLRTALGGSRWRLVRLVLVESLLLSVSGALVSILLAKWWLRLVLANMPADVAQFIAGWKTIGLDSGAFLFTLGVTLAAGILSGLAPALLSSRTNLSEMLKEGGRGSSAGRAHHRLRSVLVVAEVSLALVLLVCAGLLVKSFRGLVSVNAGYSPSSLLAMNLSLPELGYERPEARRAFHERVLRELSAIPGVQSASLASRVPFSDGGWVGEDSFAIEGRPKADRGEMLQAIIENVDSKYFEQFHVDAQNGRLLNDGDSTDSQRVAVVSESLVRTYFAGENPLGHHIRVRPDDPTSPSLTIVGVVNDLRYSWISKQNVPTIYRSFRQSPPYFTTLVLRTTGAPSQFVSAARSAVASVDPNLPLFNIKPMDKVISESVIGIAYMATMMAILGFIALVLASVGVFGVMSYAVTERAHEIGVRMSMGAKPGDIVRMVLNRGMLLTGIGLAVGLPLALLMSRALANLLFGVDATDPVAFVGLPMLLAAVAALACYLPAWRAARMDPLKALRHD